MKKLLIILLVLGLVAAFALPAVATRRAPANLTLEVPGQAPVAFDHAAHEALASNCKDCHHYGIGTGSCGGCHGKTSKAPSLAVAYEKCKTCHSSTPDPAATSCSDYSDRRSCKADPDCRWQWRKGVCVER